MTEQLGEWNMGVNVKSEDLLFLAEVFVFWSGDSQNKKHSSI